MFLVFGSLLALFGIGFTVAASRGKNGDHNELVDNGDSSNPPSDNGETDHSNDHPENDHHDHGDDAHGDDHDGRDFHGVATPGRSQIHQYGLDTDDYFAIDFQPINVRNPQEFSHGHHVFGSHGADTFNFINTDNVVTPISGRIEDFNPTYDTIQVNGHVIDLNNLPEYVRIVEYNGEISDQSEYPQQYLLINDNIFYALEGARYDPDIRYGGGGERIYDENHFNIDLPDFDSLNDVDYEFNYDFLPRDAIESSAGTRMKLNTSQFDNNSYDDDPRYGDIQGTNHSDIIESAGGRDVVRGLDGDDLIAGGNSADLLYGGDGNDTIYGGSGDDTVYGGQGDDILFANAGDDALFGGDGNDTLHAGYGDDRLSGGDGDDLFIVGNENAHRDADTTLIGGGGNDTYIINENFDRASIVEAADGGEDRIEFIGVECGDVTIEAVTNPNTETTDLIFNLMNGTVYIDDASTLETYVFDDEEVSYDDLFEAL